jgi:L-ascorbate metabolism protein UlaG (beta-lactamase superfamily)
MEIICLASSSAGNAYIIKNSHSTILVEVGLHPRLLRQRMFQHRIIMNQLDGVFVTHEHGDHAKAAQEFSTYTTVYAPKETIKACNIHGSSFPITQPWEPIRCVGGRKNGFTVWPFDLDHSNPDGTLCTTYGYIVEDLETEERLLFINDTKMVKWDFSQYHFDYIMIECNHNEEILLENADERAKRTANAHMSLRTTLLTLSGLNLSKTKAIYLMHLSDGNSNEDLMLESVAKQTGKPVAACQKDGGVRWYGERQRLD